MISLNMGEKNGKNRAGQINSSGIFVEKPPFDFNPLEYVKKAKRDNQFRPQDSANNARNSM